MITLGLMLDGGEIFRDWRTFPWCIYFPAITVAVSWVLIRWKRNLVVLALIIAALAAYSITSQLSDDILLRERQREFLEGNLRSQEAHFSEAGPGKTVNEQFLIQQMRRELHFFDSQMQGKIPPYDRPMIMAVWFSAVFPFVLIIAFCLSAANPPKAQKSLPASD